MSRPSDSDLYQLFERSPIGIYRTTETGRIVYANPALAKLLEYDAAALTELDIARDVFVDPADRAQLFAAARARGVIDGAQVRWKTRTGRALIVRLFGHLTEHPDGSVTCDVSVLDVTESEAASAVARLQRAEVERSATTLAMVIRQVHAIWWLCDRDLRILRTGGPIEDVLGYAPETYIGRTFYEIVLEETGKPTDDSIVAHEKALRGEIATYINEYRDKFIINTVAPYVVDGEQIGVIGALIDATTSHTLEKRMIEAQRAESLGLLAGGLAHDFNNLLVAIIGNADLGLRETSPGAPGHTALDNIRAASLRAAELTDQLLAYAGRSGTVMKRVFPAPLVGELLKLSSPRMPASVRVQVDIPEHLAIHADASQVRQVAMNLIGNASEALAAKGGTLAIRASTLRHDGALHEHDVLSAPAGDYVVLEVADDGEGIAPQTMRRIFDPFFTTKETGHGLGLAAVLGIVRAHGGGIRVESTPACGARFQILWPAESPNQLTS